MQDSNNQPQNKMAAEKDKILMYLREQLNLKIDALSAMEGPIEMANVKDVKELELMMIRREIYELKRHIQVIEMII